MNKTFTNEAYMLKTATTYMFEERSMLNWWSADPGKLYETAEDGETLKEKEAFKVKGKHFSWQDTLWLSGMQFLNDDVLIGAKTKNFTWRYTRDIVLPPKEGEKQKPTVAVVQSASVINEHKGNFNVYVGDSTKGKDPDFQIVGGNRYRKQVLITHVGTGTVCCSIEKKKANLGADLIDQYCFAITIEPGQDAAFFLMVAVACLDMSKKNVDDIFDITLAYVDK